MADTLRDRIERISVSAAAAWTPMLLASGQVLADTRERVDGSISGGQILLMLGVTGAVIAYVWSQIRKPQPKPHPRKKSSGSPAKPSKQTDTWYDDEPVRVVVLRDDPPVREPDPEPAQDDGNDGDGGGE